MKKILKISILAALFVLALTIRSYAAEVSYGDLQSDGSMKVTITYQIDPGEETITGLQNKQYTVDTENKKLTKTFSGVNNGPKFEYVWWTTNDNREEFTIATPYRMTLGESRTLETDSGCTITNSSNTSVVSITNTTYTAQSVGTSTLTLTGEGSEIYSLDITVVNNSDDEDLTPDGCSAKYDGRKLVVSGLLTGNIYRVAVDNNATKDYSSSLTTYLLAWDQGDYISESTPVDLMQLNQDLYAHIYTTIDEINYTKVADVKITKPTFNNYNYFSSLSHATKTHTQLLFDLPYDLNKDGMTRKIHYKIGSISDVSILRLFKNGDATGFARLMEYAENDSNPLYDEVKSPTYSNGYAQDGEIIAGSKLSDNAFYYLYAELDDEDGKYIPLKSVTLAQADVYPDQDYSWYLFFYGSKELNFDGVSDPTTPDEEKKPSVLPATGEKALVFALIGVSAVAVVIFRKRMRKF